MSPLMDLPEILDAPSISRGIAQSGQSDVRSPIDGNTIANVAIDSRASVYPKVATVGYPSDLPLAQGIELGTVEAGARRIA